MINFIKNILTLDKSLNKSNNLKQMTFEQRLEYYKNNDSKPQYEQRDRSNISFM